jgi:3-hydroxyisobutyrate dehydrogenase-like beta-hydroxyacid dehydrogenase
VNDIKKEIAQPLLDKGAKWVATPKELAQTCDMILSFLPNPPDVEAVALGENGLIAGWKKGDIYIDLSTNSPTTMRRIAAAAKPLGVGVLDAPVTGGVIGAKNGTMTLMIGGDAAILEKSRKILEVISGKIVHLGDVGAGNITKLVNNLISISCNSICAEGMVLAAKAGIDIDKLFAVVSSGTANCWNLLQYPNSVFVGDFKPGFKLDLAHKDLRLAIDLAQEIKVPTPVAAAAWQGLVEARALGLGEQGLSSVITKLEKAVGVEVRTAKK